jgi:hypothetical protein
MNRFRIVVNCPYNVTDAEWFELLMKFNEFLQTYNKGYYSTVNAILEEAEGDDNGKV